MEWILRKGSEHTGWYLYLFNVNLNLVLRICFLLFFACKHVFSSYSSFALCFLVTHDQRLPYKLRKNRIKPKVLRFAYMSPRWCVSVMHAHGSLFSMKSKITLSSCHFVFVESKSDEWTSLFSNFVYQLVLL